MFDRIKDLMKVQQQIDDIKAKTEANTKAMEEFSAEMRKLDKHLVDVKESQDKSIEGMQQNLTTFTNLREDLGKEIYDFRLLKSHLQKKILDKFEEEVSKELKVNVETLRKDISDYEDMKTTVRDLLRRMELSKQELDKWLEISQNIKKEDFELHKFARQLQQADQEKLELMRKIDHLERLVSKMRRGQPQQIRR